MPACGAFEKTGTTTNLAGDVLPVDGPFRRRTTTDGDMLVALAEALAVAVPSPDEIEQRIRVLVSTAPAIPPMPEPDAVPRAMVERDALRVVVESTIFTGGGTLAHDAQLDELRTPPRATIHPQTAAQMTIPLVRGDVIDIAGPGGVKLRGLTDGLDRRARAAKRRTPRRRHPETAQRVVPRPRPASPSRASAATALGVQREQHAGDVPLWIIVLIRKSAILLLVVVTTFAYSMLAERKIMADADSADANRAVRPWA